jgi:hypothetical protein
MAETTVETVAVQNGATLTPTGGTAGVQSQVAGAAATVSNVANATDGIEGGHMIETDIDKELFKIKGDDTPLTQIVLKAKKVKVSSPEIEHYMIDEPRASVTTTAAVEAGELQAVLPLGNADRKLPQAYATLLVKGVDGYAADGKTKTVGKDLMLFVTGRDTVTGNPVVHAVNGPKDNAADETCTMVAIPAGTTIVLLSNALYETQKEVAPDLIIPQPTKVYAQKRGMNQVVSDYLDAVRKRIPYSKALIAESAIWNFKVKANRTFWAGRASKFTVDTKLGAQTVYTTEGIRWQFRKELQHTGKWTIEQLIALTKMAYTGEDVPKSVTLLAGKNFLENIQCIDYSKHPEIQISIVTSQWGWKVTNLHTVFGDIEIKHEPTLDRLGWSNSGALIAPDRIVHYVYSAEHSAKDRVEGEEASREALLVWDAVALKGSCHIWIDGEGEAANEGAVTFAMWDSSEAPENPTEGKVYYLLADCAGIASDAVAGQMWQYKSGAWVEYAGDILAA